MRPSVELYADGSCLGNPGPGGWAYLLRAETAQGQKEKEAAGAEAVTTNNKMELTAVIRGLEALKSPCRVKLFCDSQYVVKGLRDWLPGWKAKGWKKADGSAVLNLDLWQQLDTLMRVHTLDCHWVKGHAGHPENERVDQKAREAAESASRS